VKVRVRYEARCLVGCGWTPETGINPDDDPDRAARRHTGDKETNLKDDGCFHATVVVGVPE
jgi:hypothetical protein